MDLSALYPYLDSSQFPIHDHHMSSQQSVDIQTISDDLAGSYVDLAALALLAYDTLLTLPSEITYIWRRRVRLGTVLYLLARYPAILVSIITVYLDIANIPLEYDICVFLYIILYRSSV
ncbi:hypothetical protein JB92DRAFT_2879205, partial [Gautieria morchelliformis]